MGIGLPDKVPKACIYACVGVKACTYFLPKNILSKFPFGGGWIYMNEYLQVTEVPPERPPAPQVSNLPLTGKVLGTEAAQIVQNMVAMGCRNVCHQSWSS